MSTRVLWILASAMAITLVAPKAGAVPAGETISQAQALELQKRFEDAQIAGDAGVISMLMADDGLFIHATGAVQTKAEFVGSIAAGRLRPSKFESSDRRVILFDGGAIVEGAVAVTLNGAGAPPTSHTTHVEISSLWVHTPLGWQLMLSHATTINTQTDTGTTQH
jgi:Domain of unknown function (DUF4440)